MKRIAKAVLDRGKSRLEAAAEAGVCNTVVGRVTSLEAAGNEMAGLGDQFDRDAADLLVVEDLLHAGHRIGSVRTALDHGHLDAGPSRSCRSRSKQPNRVYSSA